MERILRDFAYDVNSWVWPLFSTDSSLRAGRKKRFVLDAARFCM